MLAWKNDSRLVVDGVDFVLAPTTPNHARGAVDAGSLLLRKPRWMVERYAALEVPAGPNVFELGIYEGGSTALLSLLLRPRRLVAIDLRPSRTSALDDFITARGLREHVRPYYGVDQTDRARLSDLIAAEFGAEPLDLVIDDASHLLDETTASFNALFPRLRPGALFVIEDWSWQHFRDEALEEKLRSDPVALEALTRRLEAGPAVRKDPLSRLVLELVLTAGYAEEIVAEVTSARRGWLVVRRGEAPLDPVTFDISTCYGSLGRALLP